VTAAERVAGEQLAFELPGLPTVAPPPAPRARNHSRRPAAATAPVVPPVAPVVSVWGLWDGEDLVGVRAGTGRARGRSGAAPGRVAGRGAGPGDRLRAGAGVLGGAARPSRRGRIRRVTADADVVPAGYAELLERLKARVQATQVRAARAANSEVLGRYWSVGRDILDRQDQLGWGGKVIARLAGGLAGGVPGPAGLVVFQPAVHAGLRRRVAGPGDLPTSCGETPVGARPRSAGPVGHPGRPGLVRRAGRRAGLVPGGVGVPDRQRVAPPGRGGPVELRRAAASGGLRPGPAAGAGPVRVRSPVPVPAGRRTGPRAGVDGPVAGHGVGVRARDGARGSAGPVRPRRGRTGGGPAGSSTSSSCATSSWS